MWRKSLIFLKEWASELKPKPLILRGARQVGKSTLVKLFAEENSYNLIEINFENIKLKSLKNENFNFNLLIHEIEILSNKKIDSKTLIFFDEIQEMPEAISKLRYFYEQDKSYLVIGAGSLLELVIESENISMPVGRIEYLYIGPMTFFEFLMAVGDNQLLNVWDQAKHSNNYIHIPFIHDRFTQVFKDYLYVGGMPEAVKVYVQNLNNQNMAYDKIRRVHHSILNTYFDDIPKYTKRSKLAEFSQACFNFTLNHIAESNFKLSDVAKTNSKVIRDAFLLLKKAQIISLCFHSNATGLPLSALQNENIFKLFFLDVGLYNASRNLSYKEIFNLSGNDLVEKGAIVEQFVAQHLLFIHDLVLRPELFYWMNINGKNNYEVDFIFSHDSKIYPLEVKSGSNSKSKSLNQCLYKTQNGQAIKLDLKYREKFNENRNILANNSENKIVEINIHQLSIPIYFVELLKEFVNHK